jgi:hypothetical protein
MDDKEIQDTITRQIEKLPQDVKDAVFSVDYSATLDQITKKNRLLIDQEGKLETETTLVMVGLEPLADYKKNILKNVGVDEKTANLIIVDVDDLIFKKIRISLQKMNEEMEREEFLEESNIKRDSVLSGIENPNEIAQKEGTVSFSSLASNSGKKMEKTEIIETDIEINTPINSSIPEMKQISPTPRPVLLMTNTLSENPEKGVKDVIEEKMNSMTSLPKESVVIEEERKIPQKSPTRDTTRNNTDEIPKKVDLYREPIE